MKKWILAFSMMFAAPALAAPDAVVEGVAMPAWLERDGNRVPLEAGVQLKDRDQIRTGPSARLLVKTADGSFVKLGENAVLKLDNLSQKRREQLPLFTAILDVLEGAFRFTTRVTRFARRRDVTVIISNLTLGVRGTDVWGKAAADKDIVCLIQGKISVARGAGHAVYHGPATVVLHRAKECSAPAGGTGFRQAVANLVRRNRNRERTGSGAPGRKMESHRGAGRLANGCPGGV